MIKQRIIASIVGGIILFVWQASSWMFLGIHDSEVRYNPQQEQILNLIASSTSEDGTYVMPNLPPGSSQEQQEKLMKDVEGKPSATITYIKSYRSDMTMSMIRGFLLDVFLVYLFIYITTRGGIPPFIRIIAASVSIGLFTWLWEPYTMHVWYQTPWSSITSHLIDSIVAWALCGLWVGWYLNRKRV